MAKIIRIGLEGGDSAGKTEIDPFLRNKLEERGIKFIFIPEVASRLIKQYGVKPRELQVNDPAAYFRFQFNILKTILREEDLATQRAEEIAHSDELVVIAMDRTAPGSACYATDEEFTRMLNLLGLNRMLIRDGRYDAILHMVTAADGAPEAYLKSVAKNPARHDCPPEIAIMFDQVTQRHCLGHPHHRIIDNSTGFEEKMERVWRHVEQIINPARVETERKFWIYNRPDMSDFPVPFQPIGVRQDYLKDSPGHRVRVRSQENEGELYYETKKTPTASLASSKEDERMIEHVHYEIMLQHKDEMRDPIVKTRHHFIWNRQSFELDFFHEPKPTKAITILEVELLREDEPVQVPPWLGEYVEVTHDPRFKNSTLCKKSAAL